MKSEYSKMAQYYDAIAIARKYYVKQFEVLKSVFKSLELNESPKILDAACGTGKVGELLSGKGYEVFLNDRSKEMTKRLQNSKNLQT